MMVRLKALLPLPPPPAVAATVNVLVPVAVGSVTFAAWILNIHPGIDALFVDPYIATLTPVPGRMPVNNALSLILSGTALLLAALAPTATRVTIAWALGAMVCPRVTKSL